MRRDVRAVAAAVEAMLTDWMETPEQAEAVLINGKEEINRHYKGIRIDTRNEQQLTTFIGKKLGEYLSEGPDNTIADFIAFEIERAMDYQQHFPKSRHWTEEQKAIHYALQRWIDAVYQIEKTRFEAVSAHNDLAFYKSPESIPNQDLVTETLTYFEKGAGARVFKPLPFLNLLWKQYNFVNENIEQADKVFETLNQLALTEIEKHILFGFILKWFGGYPVNNLNEDYHATLKLIEKGFLAFPGETPEKEFCKVNREKRRQFTKLEIALNTAIKHNLDARQVYEALEKAEPTKKGYDSFDELFEDAVRFGSVGKFDSRQAFLIQCSRYNYLFNVWLQETNRWEYNNDETYTEFLTKENWLEFLKHERQQEAERQTRIEKEKQSWQIQNSPPTHKMEDFFKRVEERHKLRDFLKVPAPDVVEKDAFWHDQNDEPIDCNPYHPKYGYPGFEANTQDVLVTSFNPVTVYKGDNGKYVYCRYSWGILCIDEEGNYTNKDGKKVVKVDWVRTNQTRLAESEADFETILQRELNAKKQGFTIEQLADAAETVAEIKSQVANYVEELKKLHKEKSSYIELDSEVLTLAGMFLSFLRKPATNQSKLKKPAMIEGPEFALFCSIVNESRLLEMVDEGKASFCSRVKERFAIPANPKQARKIFNPNMDVKANCKKLKKVEELILPYLNDADKQRIQAFINGKTNLYG